MDFELRNATAADAEFLQELFNDVHGPEFQLARLPAEMLSQLLAMQLRAQQTSYAARFPDAVDQIVCIRGERAGRWLVHHGAQEVCLVDVALLGRFRGLGVGTSLLEQLCGAARASEKQLRLTVRVGNRAARLYERMGFVAVGGDGMNIQMELAAKPVEACEAKPGAGSELASKPECATDSAISEQRHTLAYFQSLVGSRVLAQACGRPQASTLPVELVVDGVRPLSLPISGGAVEADDSFIVDLHGPVEQQLPAETVQMTAPNGAAMPLFITPLGPRGGHMQYEVVFNRMRPV
jgi:GNAT superfamily N-acetyltransferase